MVKGKILSLLILIVIVLTNFSYVYGTASAQTPIQGGYNLLPNVNVESTDTSEIAKIIEDMSSGYYGSENNPTIATVLMQVSKTKDSNGNIIYKVGKGSNAVEWYATPADYLFDNDGSKEIGSIWGVWMDIEYVTDPEWSGTNEDGNITSKYSAMVSQTYLDADGSFDPEKDGWKGQKAIDKVVKAIEKGFETVVGTGQKVIDVATWTAKFFKNQVGVGVSTIMDILVGWLGDGLQWWASIPQTWRDKTYSDWTITYSYDELQKDAAGESIKDTKKFSSDDAIGNRDIYTKVGSYEKKRTAVASINLKKKKYKDYTEDTEIPVMIGDVYNIAMNRLDFLDTNFLTGNKETKANSKNSKHDDNSTWSLLRSFITILMHATIYIASGLLIMILIWNGFQIVRHSMDNPQEKAKYQEALEDFAKAVAMLIGSVFIMALCIMSSKIFGDSLETKGYELPIRIKVENADYSFSTTVAGYARYMASTDDENEWSKKLEFGMAYIGLAFINFVAVYAMVIRMFVLGFLSVLGPIIAVQYAFKREPILSYGSWTGMYIVISVLPMVCMQIAYKLILAPIS